MMARNALTTVMPQISAMSRGQKARCPVNVSIQVCGLPHSIFKKHENGPERSVCHSPPRATAARCTQLTTTPL